MPISFHFSGEAEKAPRLFNSLGLSKTRLHFLPTFEKNKDKYAVYAQKIILKQGKTVPKNNWRFVYHRVENSNVVYKINKSSLQKRLGITSKELKNVTNHHYENLIQQKLSEKGVQFQQEAPRQEQKEKPLTSGTSPISSPANKVSPAIQSIIDYMVGKEQAKLFIAVGSHNHEVIFRKDDKSPLDKAFITSHLIAQLGNQDLKQLDSNNLNYRLYAKRSDGCYFQAYKQQRDIGHTSYGKATSYIPDLEKGDFVLIKEPIEQLKQSIENLKTSQKKLQEPIQELEELLEKEKKSTVSRPKITQTPPDSNDSYGVQLFSKWLGGRDEYYQLPALDLSKLEKWTDHKTRPSNIPLEKVTAPIMRGTNGFPDSDYLIVKFRINIGPRDYGPGMQVFWTVTENGQHYRGDCHSDDTYMDLKTGFGVIRKKDETDSDLLNELLTKGEIKRPHWSTKEEVHIELIK